MKYEKPIYELIIIKDVILTSYLDVGEMGGNDEDDDIVIMPIQ